MLRTASLAAGLVLLAGCKPPPHPVERVEVVAASLAEAQLLALTPAQAQAELSERLVPERGFRLLGPGKRDAEGAVKLTLEIDAVQEQAKASGLPGLEEVTASLGIRRSTGEGVERISLQATRSQAVDGEALEGRQEAARRALDEVLDRLVKEAKVHLDARKRDDARLARDLKAADPLVRDAATLALVAGRTVLPSRRWSSDSGATTRSRCAGPSAAWSSSRPARPCRS